ncbi:MAG: DUF3866 family protein [Caldanaerobacter sp.]
MISIYLGQISKIISKRGKISIVEIEAEGEKAAAINYNEITGEVEEGDLVYVNRTARLLNLGTGGYDFIIANLKYNKFDNIGKGHIMKLRYTPLQVNLLTMEEETSPYHQEFDKFKNLNGFPVIIGELHSMVTPSALVLKKLLPDIKITYIMTDGGALPLPISNTVYKLKGMGVLDATITIGHAFGGDYECVNIYTALIASKEILKSDVAIVSMGPGIVGTGTKYGFSGVEQAYIIDAVNKMGGKPVLIPRISFKDVRGRHQGISHHTITVLELCYSSSVITFPKMEEEKERLVRNQIASNPVFSRFDVRFIDSELTGDCLREMDFDVTTMGRGYEEEKEFFNACGAASIYVATELLGI